MRLGRSEDSWSGLREEGVKKGIRERKRSVKRRYGVKCVKVGVRSE